MGGNSTTWMNTAVLVTCIRNFRKNRGPVSGILKGYVGLSTAIFTDLCTALFSSSPSSFLFLLSVVPLIVCFGAMVFLKEEEEEEDDKDARENVFFSIFSGVAVIIAVYLLAFDLSGKHSGIVSKAFATGLLILLVAPLIVPYYIWSTPATPAPAPELAPLIEQPGKEEGKEEEERVDESRRIGDEHTIMEAIKTLDFWFLFFSFLCGVGTGLAVMNNMGQIGVAMGFSDVSIFVSMTSIWGFFGRIASGSISEYFIR